MDYEPTLDDIYSSEITRLREQNRVLRSNLVNCAARLEAYYGEDYPAVRDAKAALTATSQPAKEPVRHLCGARGFGQSIDDKCPGCDATSQEGQHEAAN
jgi:hypothetical protein